MSQTSSPEPGRSLPGWTPAPRVATLLEPGPPPGARSASPAIYTVGLGKRYGKTVAVKGLSLTVGRGEIFGFLGPNGARHGVQLLLVAENCVDNLLSQASEQHFCALAGSQGQSGSG